MINKKVKSSSILRMANETTALEKTGQSTGYENPVPEVLSRLTKKQVFFAIYLLAVCFPFTFGDIGRVSEVFWIEWLAPITLAFVFLKLFSRGKILLPYGGRLSSAGIILLILCSIGHILFHPVSSQLVSGASNATGGLRAYFNIFIAACVFFTTLWLTAYWKKNETTWQNIIRMMMYAALFIGFARLGTYLLGMELPMMAGVFGFHEETFNYLFRVERAHRIGGLAEVGSLGIAALFALNIDKRWKMKTYVMLYVFLFLMVMGGGRSSMVGVFLSLATYFVIMRRETGKAILFALLLIAAAIAAMQLDLFSKQFERLTSITSGIESNASGRGLIYQEMWRIFLDHLIVGKGIGLQYINTKLPDFVIAQVSFGGHGAYLSILGLFGLVGVFNFGVNLFRPILVGLKLLRDRAKKYTEDMDLRMAVTFAVSSLMVLVVESVVGGNGYMQFKLYMSAGIISGVVVRMNYAK